MMTQRNSVHQAAHTLEQPTPFDLEARDAQAAAELLAVEFEIDTTQDIDFGALYRLWHLHKLLGTFYRATSDGMWIAQPINLPHSTRCSTALQAQLLIIVATGLPVADAA